MKFQKSITGLVAAAALTTLGAHQASAQNFSFTSVYANNTITSNSSGTGTSTLTITNGGSPGLIGTPTAVVLGNISEFTPPGGGPNTFNNPYDITFSLFDAASATTKSGHFTGIFTGSADGGVGGNAPSSNIQVSLPYTFL